MTSDHQQDKLFLNGDKLKFGLLRVLSQPVRNVSQLRLLPEVAVEKFRTSIKKEANNETIIDPFIVSGLSRLVKFSRGN